MIRLQKKCWTWGVVAAVCLMMGPAHWARATTKMVVPPSKPLVASARGPMMELRSPGTEGKVLVTAFPADVRLEWVTRLPWGTSVEHRVTVVNAAGAKVASHATRDGYCVVKLPAPGAYRWRVESVPVVAAPMAAIAWSGVRHQSSLVGFSVERDDSVARPVAEARPAPRRENSVAPLSVSVPAAH